MQKVSLQLPIVNNWQEEIYYMDLSMVLWGNYKCGFPLCCQKQICQTHTKSATDGLETHPTLHWKVLDFSHQILKTKGIQQFLLREMPPPLPLNTTPHTWSGEEFDLNCSIYIKDNRKYMHTMEPDNTKSLPATLNPEPELLRSHCRDTGAD